MELYDSNHDPTRDALLTVRRPLASSALVVAGFAVGIVVVAYAASVPWWAWLLVGLVEWLLIQMLVFTVADLRSRDNWVLALDPEGVWINLRRPGMQGVAPAATVFFLRYAEIEAAREFTHRYSIRKQGRRQSHTEAHLDLLIAADDSEVIRLAVEEEGRREVPHRTTGLGGKSRIDWPMLVSIPERGTVRVGGGIAPRALPRLRDHVRVEHPVRFDEGELDRLPDERFDERMADLAANGQRVQAINALSSRYRISTNEAVARLDTLLDGLKSGPVEAGKMGKF